MKILNLYAGIGGNRKLWGNDHEITAIEFNPEIAAIYKEFFPNDNVIITDAHQYLLEHFKEFDFIWSSPPCQSHSILNMDGNHVPKYPDMTLYQQIIFFKYANWYKGKFVTENVKPYYKPLINPDYIIDRHFFWTNIIINKKDFKSEKPIARQKGTDNRFGFNIKKYKIKHRKDTILRNLVNPEIGLHFFNRALEIKEINNNKQLSIFDIQPIK